MPNYKFVLSHGGFHESMFNKVGANEAYPKIGVTLAVYNGQTLVYNVTLDLRCSYCYSNGFDVENIEKKVSVETTYDNLLAMEKQYRKRKNEFAKTVLENFNEMLIGELFPKQEIIKITNSMRLQPTQQ